MRSRLSRKKHAPVVYPNWMYFLPYNLRKSIRRMASVQRGHCKWCSKPEVSNGLCENHYETARRSSLEYHQRDRKDRVERGLCIVCRNELHEFFDEGHTNCHRCRDRSRDRLTWR